MAEILTTAEVERIAALARLALTDREKTLFTAQLAKILEYAGQLRELDIAEVPTTASVASDRPAERDDLPTPSLRREQALANAPEPASDLFRVPKVLGDA